ncbi:glycogen-debranching protein [Chlamydia sp. 17-3921]|uniref:glycogen debranching protein n=1 Tax=Chlamydia sp. 17-3921 TaxID=2675798 RepID=UPI00191B7272|nr:glycogen-debranching protein [Chlamydia sp. 17-3921]
MKKIAYHRGSPQPLGATKLSDQCYRFALFSSKATQVILVLANQDFEILEIPLSPKEHKTGFIWHIEIEGISDQWSYAFRVNGPKHKSARYSFKEYLADPYAKNLHSPKKFGAPRKFGDYAFCYLKEEHFDWNNDLPLKIPREDLIIYEMHVRSFTQSPTSRVCAPGTFLGIIEKIEHLQQLGINAIELLPIFEFDETFHPFKTSQHSHLCNYWGYAPLNCFSPCRRYAYASDPCAPTREFKTLVKALHQAGIEIILDVVFNHTSLHNTVCSLPWIDTSSYYILDSEGNFTNFSGCGNTLNTNKAPTTQWILHALHYWVSEMHVDGFRFDLASVFSRGPKGDILTHSPILEEISHDPLLADTKLIAEPWDAGGLYQVGYFPTLSSNWSEWNGPYRDNVKSFLNGNSHLLGDFASRLSGSQDIYFYGAPTNSINYVSCHDGFTLRDTVTYNQKHNEENKEFNRDGTDANYSYNFGEEGETQNAIILEIRERQIRNFFLALLLSQGIPMIQSGDEYGHTAYGNNNRWALDTEINHFLWDKLLKNSSLMEFVCKTIRLRKKYKEVFNKGFLTKENILWLNTSGEPINWAPNSFIAFELRSPSFSLYAAFHTASNKISIKLPRLRSDFFDYQLITDSSKGFYSCCLKSEFILQPHTAMVATSHTKKTN